MLNARRQAEDYARALPDVARLAALHPRLRCRAIASRSMPTSPARGKNYTQFPDRQGFRIYLEDLREPRSARAAAAHLDRSAFARSRRAVPPRSRARSPSGSPRCRRRWKAASYPPEDVALFLMRCLFTMFAEDVGLLPEASLQATCSTSAAGEPAKLRAAWSDRLWAGMNEGGFAPSHLKRACAFNGEFFKDARGAAARTRGDRRACGRPPSTTGARWSPRSSARCWNRRSNPNERRRLGAHYTPRAYVERLVVATIIEPLREDWRQRAVDCRTAEARAGDRRRRRPTVRAFHDKLCETRVLDPACGTGNFLYVALELMKRLEGEVLEALADLGGQEALRASRRTRSTRTSSSAWSSTRARRRSPSWCSGSAICNGTSARRAARPPSRSCRAFRNIQVQERGAAPGTAIRCPWCVTGRRPIRTPPPRLAGGGFHRRQPALHRRQGSARTAWRGLHRGTLGAHPHINECADFVMYWWDHAAELLTAKGTRLRRFGFVTTNSITQEFSRRVIKKRTGGEDSRSRC